MLKDAFKALTCVCHIIRSADVYEKKGLIRGKKGTDTMMTTV